jgi:hypothetical protein
MYDKDGLNFGDLKNKIVKIMKEVPDDTPVWITFDGYDEAYQLHSIGVTGIKLKNEDDEDRPHGCPVGLEIMSEDHLSQSDILQELDYLGDEAFDMVLLYLDKHDLISKILNMYGGGRYGRDY